MSAHRPESAGNLARESAWQDRLIVLAQELRAGVGDADARVVPELWRILHVKLMQHVRSQAARRGALAAEDLEELAAKKALELLNRIDSGLWDAAQATPAEVVAFVSTVARNGVLDALRQTTRQRRVVAEEFTEQSAATAGSQELQRPDDAVAGQEYAQALVRCAGALKALHRRIWMFRVFYDMSSKQIAGHPEVALKPAHVDVILQRTRQRLLSCMQTKGLAASDMPPGTFAELWTAFRIDAAMEGGRAHGR